MLMWGLALVLLVSIASVVVWVWSMRKPPPAPAATTPSEEAPQETPRPLSYVAIGNSDVGMLLGGKPAADGRGWSTHLLGHFPPGTEFTLVGNGPGTLREINTDAISTLQAKPDIVTLWSVVSDSTKGTPLIDYLGELRKALDHLTRNTEAQVVLLNLPDITLLMEDQPEDRKALVRGGIGQWNRVIAEATTRYGRRVLLVDLYPISAQVLDAGGGNGALAEAVWGEISSAKRET